MAKKTYNRKPKTDVYQSVTDTIVEAIEKGMENESWEMPWSRKGAEMGFPSNASTQNLYRGVNIMSLWAAKSNKEFSTDIWATYKQWKDKGCQVRKGEKGSIITFYKKFKLPASERRDENDDGTRLMAKSSTVFNADQVDGYTAEDLEEQENLVKRLAKTEQFIKNTEAKVNHGGGRAYFSPAEDYIQMPKEERFIETESSTATEGYYSTLLHELTHWTGHKSRLKRDFTGRFGSEAYAAEELVAELGAAFMCAQLGISSEPREDHAKYLKGWLKVLKSDKKAIFTASAQAQKAVEYLNELQK